ncbi:hypothetical protein SP41_85 [Salmonella phage 41]|nr:hypothetical protein SP41_85 [Salmonella phage 41]
MLEEGEYAVVSAGMVLYHEPHERPLGLLTDCVVQDYQAGKRDGTNMTLDCMRHSYYYNKCKIC